MNTVGSERQHASAIRSGNVGTGAQREHQTGIAAHAANAPGAADIDALLQCYRPLLTQRLRSAVEAAKHSQRATSASASASELAARLDGFYGQIEYHLGWRAPDLSPAGYHPGKLLRPTLLLLACELAAGRAGADTAERERIVERASGAAVTVELIHNFSLIHDDIEDADEERRHRPTLWKLWGIPEAVNSGDGLFSLARLSLWQLAEDGVAPSVVVRLASLLDRTCLELCEGQFLDMRFEGQQDISVALYLEMIGRKTAALMAASAEMGGMLGAPDDEPLHHRLAEFGRSLGLAFQIRDDLLGIWSATELGKSAAGDLRRKKMSLPVIYAREHASPEDAARLDAIYEEPGPATAEQIDEMLAILDRAGARSHTRALLDEHCATSRAALEASAGTSQPAIDAARALRTLVDFVAAEGI